MSLNVVYTTSSISLSMPPHSYKNKPDMHYTQAGRRARDTSGYNGRPLERMEYRLDNSRAEEVFTTMGDTLSGAGPHGSVSSAKTDISWTHVLFPAHEDNDGYKLMGIIFVLTFQFECQSKQPSRRTTSIATF